MKPNEASPPPADLDRTALLGELARPAFHDCNDFLNNLLLHLALVEDALPESARDDLSRVKQKAKSVAALIGEWQRFRKPEPPSAEVDLREAIDDAVADIYRGQNAPTDIIAVAAPSAPVMVRSPLGSLRRLCYLLIRNAVDACAIELADARVEIASAGLPSGVQLTCDDNRTGVPDSLLQEWFDPTVTHQKLEVVACRSIAQRCGAAIHAERSSLGGVRVVVTLTLAI